MVQHLAVTPSRDFPLGTRQGSEEESHMEANVKILGILFVHAIGICFGLEVCTLKVAFEKQIIHSVNFLVAWITKILSIQV
jgi:hypothetical protein